MVAEPTGSKYGLKEKRKESKPDSAVSVPENGSANLPMLSSGDNENQAMNAPQHQPEFNPYAFPADNNQSSND